MDLGQSPRLRHRYEHPGLRHTFAEWANPADWIVYPWEVRSDGTRDDFGGANNRLP